ncbi:MAG: ester cyclase [Aggregatilineales bacterium]
MSENNGHELSVTEQKSEITLQKHVDIQYMQNPDGTRRHSMEGFDPKFSDFVDYIIRVTHEIWEEKAIGKLYDYYANTIQIHTSGGTIYGRDTVLAGTIATLAAYPDRRLYGDEVIWGGDDKTGFYSSHRLTHAGTNRGWSLYGAPTGKKVNYRAIADCFARRNMIVEEWLVRDELTLIRQLGLHPVETAQKMARAASENDLAMQIPGDVERGIGQLPPPVIPASDTFDPENFITRSFHEVWNWRLLNKVREYFSDSITLESASMRKIKGQNDYQTYVLSLLSPFPDLRITPEHFCYVGDETEGYRTATRWRMRGTHTGYGIYGEPLGNPIDILGVSHHLIKHGKIQAEWTLFDEFELLKQIHRPQS